MRVEVKFCGLTRPEDARAAAALGARYVGVIFAGGPRNLDAGARARGARRRRRERRSRGRVRRCRCRRRSRGRCATARLDVVQLHADPDRRRGARDSRGDGRARVGRRARRRRTRDARRAARALGGRRRLAARRQGAGCARRHRHRLRLERARERAAACAREARLVSPADSPPRTWARRSRRCRLTSWTFRRASNRRPASRITRASPTFVDAVRRTGVFRHDCDRRPADRFGAFGGRYVPETLIPALDELEARYDEAMRRSGLCCRTGQLLATYVGRPSPLSDAPRLSELVGAPVLLKREDLNHTGAHKINNTVGQVLLARRMGKRRIIAETGAGQHGVATATVCARFGLSASCTWARRTCGGSRSTSSACGSWARRSVPVTSGNAHAQGRDDRSDSRLGHERHRHVTTSSDRWSDRRPIRAWCATSRRSSAARRARRCSRRSGGCRTTVVACVGGGSNAMGIFHRFRRRRGRGAGRRRGGGRGARHRAAFGVAVAGHARRAARLAAAICFRTRRARCIPAHSISAGLDYPGVGPEHSYLKDSGRATYVSVTDGEALEGFVTLSRLEGIIPALETAHAMLGREGARALVARRSRC